MKEFLSVLDIVRESVSPSLINDDGYERLEALAGMLPIELPTCWGFECRMGRSEALADIAFEIKRRSQAQRLLAGCSSSILDGICDKWPVWQNLRSFAKHWADPKHPFHDQVHNIWLEFDTAATPASVQPNDVIQRPSIFFGPVSSTLKKEQLLNLIRDTFSAMGLKYFGDHTLPCFIESLPQGCQLFQVGLMIARPSCDLRVCVKHLSPETLPDWLANLNWNGNIDTLAELLDEILPMVNNIALDLNLTEDGPEENIGLECHINQFENVLAQWTPLLDFLWKRNLCLPKKRQGLLNFLGTSRMPFHPCKNTNGVIKPTFFRRINHLKLGIVGGEVAEAKAYLFFYRPGIGMGELRSFQCFSG